MESNLCPACALSAGAEVSHAAKESIPWGSGVSPGRVGLGKPQALLTAAALAGGTGAVHAQHAQAAVGTWSLLARAGLGVTA